MKYFKYIPRELSKTSWPTFGLEAFEFRAEKLSSSKTSEMKECRVEIILCSAEEALTKEFTSELKSSSSKLHQPSLWINRILCKHGQARG